MQASHAQRRSFLTRHVCLCACGQPLLPVPWSAGKIVQVMLLWLVAFWVLGYFALPGSLELLGLERDELTARGQVRTVAVLCMHASHCLCRCSDHGYVMASPRMPE